MKEITSRMGTRGGSSKNIHSIENQAKKYLGEDKGKIADEAIRSLITEHQMNSKAFSLTLRRTADEAKTLSAPSPASSMFKCYGTEQNKNRYEVMLKILGSQGLGWEGDGYEERELLTTREWLRSKSELH